MDTIAGTANHLGVWRDLIREHFVALEIEADGEGPFRGNVRTTPIGHLKVASVDCRTAQDCTRTPGLARRDDQVYLQVGLLTQGAAVLRQDGREAALRPGAFALYETDRPFFWRLRDDWELLVFTWPREAVAVDAAQSRRLTARALDGGSGLGGIVGRMLRDLVAAPPELSRAGGIRLADEVAELVTTVATERVSGDHPAAPTADDLVARIEAYIAEHLGDPDLCPDRIAAAQFLSTRHLHRLFARSGSTVTSHIRGKRLEQCRRDLLDPRHCRSITEIARRWGFTDAATFSRAFRGAYRLTPSSYRDRFGA